MKNGESKLQINCVKWFDLQYPKLKQLLFAIPNGHVRNKITASICKAEGVRAGVPDVFLSVAANPKANKIIKLIEGRFENGAWWEKDSAKPYHGLYIEFKWDKGKQTDSQKAFEKSVTKQGYRYEIIKDFDSFKNLIEWYLSESDLNK